MCFICIKLAVFAWTQVKAGLQHKHRILKCCFYLTSIQKFEWNEVVTFDLLTFVVVNWWREEERSVFWQKCFASLMCSKRNMQSMFCTEKIVFGWLFLRTCNLLITYLFVDISAEESFSKSSYRVVRLVHWCIGCNTCE